MTLRRIAVEAERAVYSVESPDMNPERVMEEVGRLMLHPKADQYIFEPGARWLAEGIPSPESLRAIDWARVASNRTDNPFPDKWLLPAAMLARWAERLLSGEELPEVVPPWPSNSVDFGGEKSGQVRPR